MRILMASFNHMYVAIPLPIIFSFERFILLQREKSEEGGQWRRDGVFHLLLFYLCAHYNSIVDFLDAFGKYFSLINIIICDIQEMEAYIRGLIPNLAQLRDMPTAFMQMYCRIAAHKFFFFCDPHRRGILLCYYIFLLF